MKRQYKCPVCGAPVEGEKCEYCGCVIYDFALIDFNNPCYIRLKLPDFGGHEYIMSTKVICANPSIEIIYDDYYVDGSTISLGKTMNINLELTAVTNEQNKLFKLTQIDKPYRESWRDDIE